MKMKVLCWRTCPHKDSRELEGQAVQAVAVEHRSLRFVEVLGEGEVISSVEAAVVSHMARRAYQVGETQVYTSAVEGVAAAENKVKEQEGVLEEVKDVAKRAAKVYLWDRLLTSAQTTPPMAWVVAEEGQVAGKEQSRQTY